MVNHPCNVDLVRGVVKVPFPFVGGEQEVPIATQQQVMLFNRIEKNQKVLGIRKFLTYLSHNLDGYIILIDHNSSVMDLKTVERRGKKLLEYCFYFGMRPMSRAEIKKHFPEMANHPGYIFKIRLFIHEFFHLLVHYARITRPASDIWKKFFKDIVLFEDFLTNRFKTKRIAITGYTEEYLDLLAEGLLTPPLNLDSKIGNEETVELLTSYWLGSHYILGYLEKRHKRGELSISEWKHIVLALQSIISFIEDRVAEI